MALSKEWNTATEIYKTNTVYRDFSKIIYRCLNGYEALIIGETTDCWLIEDFNGCKSKIWKNTSKPRIKKVSSDYVIKQHTFSK